MEYADYAEIRLMEEADAYARECGPDDGLDFTDDISCENCGTTVFATYVRGRAAYYGCSACGFTVYPEAS